MDEPVNISEQDGVVTITLNSPANRNALSFALASEVNRGLDIAEERGRLVILRATGNTFCAGADLKERRSGAKPPPDVFERLVNVSIPVLAVVEGAARAGGIGLVAAADIAIGTEDANFAVSEVHRGLIPAVISVVCAQRMNFRMMQQYFLTGERFDAQLAAEMGLLSEFVEATRLEDRIESMTSLLRAGAPQALADTKLLLRDVTTGDPSAKFEEMKVRSRRAFESSDGQEGMLAFLEKRDPYWVSSLS